MQSRLDGIQNGLERFSQPGKALDKLKGLQLDADKALQDEEKKPGGGDEGVKQKLMEMLEQIMQLMQTTQKQGQAGGGAP